MTKTTERQIDAIVYRLFDLEPNEIALIENARVKTRRGNAATDAEEDDE